MAKEEKPDYRVVGTDLPFPNVPLVRSKTRVLPHVCQGQSANITIAGQLQSGTAMAAAGLHPRCRIANGGPYGSAATNEVAPRMDFANVLWESLINKVVNPV